MFERTMLAAGFLLLTMANAFAQEFPYLPTVNDLPIGYEFTDGGPADILGVGLGQLRSEAQAAMAAAYPMFENQPTETLLAVADASGNETPEYRYYVTDWRGGVATDRTVAFAVYYSTAISGERVTGVIRNETLTGTQPDVNTFIEALKTKYGPPSLESERSTGLTLEWGWIDGSHATPERFVGNTCEYSLSKTSYTFWPDRTDDRNGCTAYFQVLVEFGERRDLIGSFSMSMYGLQRHYDNSVATDQWLSEEFARVIAAKGGGAAPSL